MWTERIKGQLSLNNPSDNGRYQYQIVDIFHLVISSRPAAHASNHMRLNRFGNSRETTNPK
jgi:hypothetical protein